MVNQVHIISNKTEDKAPPDFSVKESDASLLPKKFLGMTIVETVCFLSALLLITVISKYYNYLLFHTSVELFSILIAATISIVTINCWPYIGNQFVRFIGISYIFVGFLDLLHTLSFKGMPIFLDYDYYAPQFWISARYLEAASMLIGFALLDSKKQLNMYVLILFYSIITATVTISILYLKIFPICFVAGHGLTEFKIISEYIIASTFAINIAVMYLKKKYFNELVFNQIASSLVLMVLMELCFTLYFSDSMSDVFNEIGHLLKICAFYLIYKAIVVTALRDPIELLFRDLKHSEESLLEAQHSAKLGQWEWSLKSGHCSWTSEVYAILVDKI